MKKRKKEEEYLQISIRRDFAKLKVLQVGYDDEKT